MLAYRSVIKNRGPYLIKKGCPPIKIRTISRPLSLEEIGEGEESPRVPKTVVSILAQMGIIERRSYTPVKASRDYIRQ